MQIELRGKPFEIHDPIFDDLSRAIQRQGDYWEYDILNSLPVDQKVIIDVGANIGNHSHYFATYLHYDKIVCVEPVEGNYELLQKNMADFKSVELIQKAAGNSSGLIHMSLDGTNSGAHRVNETGSVEVTSIRIDDLKLDNVSLLKIDAEWYEPQVLAGAAETIKRSKPLILIEDAAGIYGQLPELAGYRLKEAWPHHNTYLYESALSST